MKKTLFLLALAISAIVPVRAQLTSRVVRCTTECAQKLIVCNQVKDYEIAFAYNEDPTMIFTNPYFKGQYQTTIYQKRSVDAGITKIVVLPNGYRVYDVGVVLLNYDTQTHCFCVFCGTKYNYHDNGANSYIDSNGFVGYYYICSDCDRNVENNVCLNDISETRQLSRLVSYTQTNTDQLNYCGTYSQSGVIDAIGLPLLNDGTTCLLRARFCPECVNSAYQWETSISKLAGESERFVDITATANKIVTVSVFDGDTHTMLMRHFSKEFFCQSSTLTAPVSTDKYTVDLSSINSGGIFYLPNPQTTYFKMPVRLNPLQNDEFTLSFVAYNGVTPTRKGLYTYRINISSTPTVVHGVLDTAVVSLIDVSRLPDTLATVWLAKNANNDYIIPTVRWKVLTPMTFPTRMAIHRLTNKYSYLQSIDTYRQSGSQYIRMGGYSNYTFQKRPMLSDHIYCTQTQPDNNCFDYVRIEANVVGIGYVYNIPGSLTLKVVDNSCRTVQKSEELKNIQPRCSH